MRQCNKELMLNGHDVPKEPCAWCNKGGNCINDQEPLFAIIQTKTYTADDGYGNHSPRAYQNFEAIYGEEPLKEKLMRLYGDKSANQFQVYKLTPIKTEQRINIKIELS